MRASEHASPAKNHTGTAFFKKFALFAPPSSAKNHTDRGQIPHSEYEFQRKDKAAEGVFTPLPR